SGSTGYDRKVWEHLTHYYKVNAWLPRNYVIINKGVWGGLDGDTRAALQKAADETGAACAAKSAELASWYFEQLEANGMKVEDAGPTFLKELQDIGAKMQADWLASVGADGQAIIDAYKAM
ncbi:MAG: C4-dicarboxylate ABC transporter substrate-binding protein, partial [Candidatus Puniceispirillaceae bacterium]